MVVGEEVGGSTTVDVGAETASIRIKIRIELGLKEALCIC